MIGSALASTRKVAVSIDVPGIRPHYRKAAVLVLLTSDALLLTAAFAACTLKNVARFAQILGFTYQQARIEVVTARQDSPPRISRVDWLLTIVTSDPPDRLRLLQTNIERQGTIYNTVAAAAEITGRIVIDPAPDPD